MRRFFYILSAVIMMFAAAPAAPAAAQNTPIGKRIPDVRPGGWLDDVRPQRDSKITCIEFFHPASSRSRKNIEHLDSLSAGFTRKDFQYVIVAAGDTESVRKELASVAGEGIAVGLDPDGSCFKAFGVNYLPACVIIDNQRKAIWAGDSKQLTTKLIENLKQ